MNRRQFLTGVSAAAVASALTAAPASPTIGMDFGASESISVVQIYCRNRVWFIAGNKTILYSEPCDPDLFVPKIA